MSVALTALFATAIHQVNASVGDTGAMDESVALLTRAANGTASVFDIVDDVLYVNDIPMSADAPGASLLMSAMLAHGTTRLALPAGLEPRHWREVAEVFASMSALYPGVDEIRDALRPSVPAAVVSRRSEGGVTDLRDAMFEIPGLMTDAGAGDSGAATGLTNRTTDRSELSARLDPILKRASEAIANRDYELLAALILELSAMEDSSDDATRTILARERRRVAPQSALEAMVRLIPRSEFSPNISRAIAMMGRDGVEAIIEAMNGAQGGSERRAYIEALTVARDADEPILASLGSARAELVRDAADVAGRRRMDAAVPTLGNLLKHNDERVRTAAWQALERIGTAEALDALYGRPTSGRSR